MLSFKVGLFYTYSRFFLLAAQVFYWETMVTVQLSRQNDGLARNSPLPWQARSFLVAGRSGEMSSQLQQEGLAFCLEMKCDISTVIFLL